VAKVSPLPAPSPLAMLQRHFFLAKLSGEIWLFEGAPGGTGSAGVQFYRLAAGRTLMARFLETQPVQSDTKKVIDQFMVSPNTLVYDRIAFSPLPTPPTTLNLWRGCPIKPAAGDWLIVRRFLLEVICAGDLCTYRYVILFLAHMLKKPEEKPGIMLVLLGGQGIGKGGFFRLLQALWRDTTLLVSDIGHVLGQFNAEIERSYVLCLDEALFVGDRRSSDRLKSLVTEPNVTIEQKYQPRRTIESHHRLFAASNHAHFAQVDPDDRRFLFLRVSETRKGDHEFWAAYHDAIADPAILAAIVHDLLTYDITNFNPRVRPQTAAHLDQKVRSLSGFDRFWNEVLHTGTIGLGDASWEGERFVSTERLMNAWQGYEKQGRFQFSAPQVRDLHEALKRLCPSAKQDRRMLKGCQQRGYNLPALPVARTEFADFLGGEAEWDE
jgi:hypothetical protein